ncbi:MAG: V-type ATP synthase subunit A [Anaerolineae bacterium]|jgi:V/A-type H+-transporting ATPase subunit A|nr:V-type ATP synthase subunit A [Anaerolineae bacterium]
MKANELSPGVIASISGPVVKAKGLPDARLHDVVYVGHAGLIGEVIQIRSQEVTIQVYEETAGIRLGEPVVHSRAPLTVELGPGLLGGVFDGLQRPLKELADIQGDFIERGSSTPRLSVTKKWAFLPAVKAGDAVTENSVLGCVRENELFLHPILVPPGKSGKITEIESGNFSVDQPLGQLQQATGSEALYMRQLWPVRTPRPITKRATSQEQLITGTRSIDLLFPLARGGSAVIPGGFGTGKTVTQQSLARWADVDVVVYVGCGERGNEMAEVLSEFPIIQDVRNNRPLMERTVLIANTSNMPVAAREASIYTGISIAEYFRAIGCDVLLLVDSTSRWAEALREISGRLEEIPGEEGFPAYLASHLASFYERSGCIELGNELQEIRKKEIASVTMVGAVSPPGSDFSEPVTQNSLRITGTFWSLDYDLSRRRHFPAINWLQSYSLYDLSDWTTENIGSDFPEMVRYTRQLLRQEAELQDIVQLIGPDTLSEKERLLLWAARMIREDLLQQSSFDPVDRFSPIQKSYWMMKILLETYRLSESALEQGIAYETIIAMPIHQQIAAMKSVPADVVQEKLQNLLATLPKVFNAILEEG